MRHTVRKHSAPYSSRTHGQAMTELLVAASALLIPLFLIVPAFGKLIDMRHATIQAARYQAWEYTVWYAEKCERTVFTFGVADPEECQMSGFEEHDEPVKARETMRLEAIQRFMGSPDGSPLSPIDPNAVSLGPSNLSWYDHTATTMVDNTIGGAVVSSRSPDGLPVIDTILDVVLGVIKIIFGAFGDVLGFLGSDAGFDAINTDGMAAADVTLTMNSAAIKRLFAQENATPMPDLSFNASAAVLTDGWNAGGRQHTYNQASGMVVTSALKALQNLPGLSTVWDLITTMIAPELRRCKPMSHTPAFPNILENPYNLDEPHWEDDLGSLWFGHVDSEAVHRDRLDDGSEGHTCDDAGRCDFADTYTRETGCIP